MIKINVFLAIYTYNNDIHRYTLTEKIFKHYKNIKEKFKHVALFTFTILGSENDISRNLSLQYFRPNAYVEFDQKNERFNGDFYKMLGEKINLGINLSAKNNPDILLWAGSNDYICFDFFKQIIEYYNPKTPQIYGIDNYNNGKNGVFYTHYDGNRCVNKKICITCHNQKSYWWDGVSDYSGRKKYKYCAGIIGINRKCYTLYPDVLSAWSFDEGAIEEYILKKPGIDKFNSKNLFYMNIKTLSKTEINTFDALLNLNKKNTLKFDNFSSYLKTKFKEEFKYFIQLHE